MGDDIQVKSLMEALDKGGICINSFDVADIQHPGRVYAHPARDTLRRWIVSFNEPVQLDPKVPDARWSGLPIMFIYVVDFEAALTLALEIGVAHKAGNVDRYIGRWKREYDEARANEWSTSSAIR